jgi:cation diffusion facilitator family transporter
MTKPVNRKVAVAGLSIFSNTLLISLKLVVGIFSGSVSIISEAAHSFMDLVAAVIAYLSVRISDRPADTKHPYGHGKFENISGVVEAMLIFVAAIWIIYEAVKKILSPETIGSLGFGIAVMAISAVVNTVISARLYKVARETGSIALEADALHLKTDVYTSLGVAIGLGLIWITGYHFLDPVVAILVALLILKESYELFRRAYGPLLDTALASHEIRQIEEIISDQVSGKFTYHGLRTRKAGNYRYVDFHLDVPHEMTVKEAHDLCDRIEAGLLRAFDHLEVTIHVEHIPERN